MEELIPVIGKLQDVFATVGRGKEIELPQIVVVGSQSAGKSSVMEGIVGRYFLPRGSGIVTRRPLLLHLHNVGPEDSRRDWGDDLETEDWAIFEHDPKTRFTDFEEVRKEIERETDKLTGTNKGISDIPIVLRVYSDKVVNLSLVDLPGITKVPVGDQPPDIEKQIRDMILKYIVNPNSLILAVTPANQDFATSEALQMAKEVDKDGLRTLVVLTKLDLMDRGTDATEVLKGNIIPVELGIVGVVNRSQEDINNDKSPEDCVQDEEKFLRKKYPRLADVNGIRYLAKKLNVLLIEHIRTCLPELKNRIRAKTREFEEQLAILGETVTPERKTIMKLQCITRFVDHYMEAIKGNYEVDSLCGGAKIRDILHGKLSKTLDDLKPMQGFTPDQLMRFIRNSTGVKQLLSVPEVCFEKNAQIQIQHFEGPSIECLEKVHEQLTVLVKEAHRDVKHNVNRFPRLYNNIQEVSKSVLQSRFQIASQSVKELIEMEKALVNGSHEKLKVILRDYSTGHSKNQAGDKNNNHLLVAPKAVDPNEEPGCVCLTGESCPWEPELSSKLAKDKLKEMKKIHKDGKDADCLTESISTKEKRDYIATARLVRQYFDIVREIMKEQIPKCIMLKMLGNLKDDLQNSLIEKLNAAGNDNLLDESKHIEKQREEATEMLAALKNAIILTNEINDAEF
ncbi:dynamin central region domain-containing protein [Ditylenchus destructor]|uniref:Dynamin central region domain-containing protein n=1 Tax=Ditylenchus destructor TaxID=166010 RepID=A0AAD4N7C9_9BILA|nr:dynamin central region domain-containing protein [Ditylenchus destructor]